MSIESKDSSESGFVRISCASDDGCNSRGYATLRRVASPLLASGLTSAWLQFARAVVVVNSTALPFDLLRGDADVKFAVER